MSNRILASDIGQGVVFITSGGTSIPIDPVRSLENFSTGVRGARLAGACGYLFLLHFIRFYQSIS